MRSHSGSSLFCVLQLQAGSPNLRFMSTGSDNNIAFIISVMGRITKFKAF